MMKRTWVFVAVGIVVLFALSAAAGWAATARNREDALRAEWPSGLGSLASLEAKYPAQREPNEAAKTLMRLSAPLGFDFAAKPARSAPQPFMTLVNGYVRTHHESGTRDIGAPPTEVTQFLAGHAAELDAVRAHLLQHEPSWPMDFAAGYEAPLPNLAAHMNLARLFVARALAAGSWDDLHAAWRVSQSLQSRPEMITQLIALAIARNVNAVAWKMPQPAPTWLEEMRATDHVYLLNRGMQLEAWFSLEMLTEMEPAYSRLVAPGMVERHRSLVERFGSVQQCGADTGKAFAKHFEDLPWWDRYTEVMTPNLSSAWARALRYRAEREATANALRVMAGQPIVTQSACSDGKWSLDAGKLAFSTALPKAGEQDVTMPLTLTITR